MATPLPTRTARRPLFEHPWRVAIVAAILVVVLNLVIVVLHETDTTPKGLRFPEAVEDVSPAPGDLIGRQETVTADLRDNLTGALLIDGAEVPEDQTDFVLPLGQVSFRPGAGKSLLRFSAGDHSAAVIYWFQGKARPAKRCSGALQPDCYQEFAWRFRVGA